MEKRGKKESGRFDLTVIPFTIVISTYNVAPQWNCIPERVLMRGNKINSFGDSCHIKIINIFPVHRALLSSSNSDNISHI